MRVKELIKYLEKMDQDAIVSVSEDSIIGGKPVQKIMNNMPGVLLSGNDSVAKASDVEG